MTKCYDLPVGQAVYYARTQQVGLVYETYNFVAGPPTRPGVCVLLCDGRDLGGLRAEEADKLLLPLGPTGLSYQFTNVGQLHHDYAAGLFDEALHNAHVLLLTRVPADSAAARPPC